MSKEQMTERVFAYKKAFAFLLIGIFACCIGFAQTDVERKERIFGAHSTSTVKSDVRTANDDIGALVDESGMFSIGTTTGKSLLYGYPYSARTSHCHFYVDGEVAGSYSDTSVVHPPPAELLLSPHNVGDTIITQWRLNGVEFTQLIVPTYIGESAQIRIEYRATNTDATSHLVGLLLFLDTMIGGNDCAPIATPLGYFATEQEFVGNAPSFWQAFEESPFQEPELLVGQGTISGWEATPPDILLYGDFWHYYSVEWEYVFTGGIYSDSAVLLRWNGRLLLSGETHRFITYYGIGVADRALGEVSLSLSHPAEIVPSGCSSFSPDTFAINLLVGCDDTLGGAVALINTPDFITIIGDNEQPISPTILPPGAVGTASWNAVVVGASVSETDSINVELTAPGYSSISISKAISIFTSDGSPPEISLLSTIPSPYALDTLTIRFQIYDGDGISLSSLSALLDGAPIEFTWSQPIMSVRLSGLAPGEHRLVLPAIADTFGCTADSFAVDFTVSYPAVPEVSLLSPNPAQYTACVDDTIAILLFFAAGWNISDFTLNIDGSTLPIGWRGDTLFSFYEALPDGEHNIRLYGEDLLGREVDSTWRFYIDSTPPEISSPSMVMELTTPADEISLNITDDGAGIDSTSIAITAMFGADTVNLSAFSTGVEYSGGNVILLLSETGLTFDGCAEMAVSVSVEDLVVNCGPNRVDTLVLRVNVPCTPPEVVLLEPDGNVSCDTLNLAILLLDDEGIIADSAFVLFNGIRYGLDSPNLYVSGDTLFFAISTAGLSDGAHQIFIGGVTDMWGNAIATDASVTFMLDKAPPIVEDVFPDGVLDGVETVGFHCTDGGSGISPDFSYIVCDGDTMRTGSGMGYDDGVIFVPAAFWLSALDGESLTVCAHIADQVAECEPNAIDTCVVFPVEQSGPAATMLYPPNRSFIGCTNQSFRMLWYDLDGIDRSASSITIGGETLPADDDRFSWNGDTLLFDVNIASYEDSFNIVVHCVDGLGFSSDAEWMYFIDRTSPQILPLSPAVNEEIFEPYVPWRILITDSGAGVDVHTISLIVDGNLFTTADDAVNIADDTLIFAPIVAGLDFGTQVNIAVNCADSAIGCPNEANYQWSYEVFRPDIWWELLSPQGIASCETVELAIVLHANFQLGLDSCFCSTGGDIFPIDARGDTVIAKIPGNMLSGGVNSVALWGFRDAEHNELISDTAFVAVMYDAFAPMIVPIFPVPGSQVGTGSPVIAYITDDLSGVDQSLVMFTFNGENVYPSPDNWSGDTVAVPVPEEIIGNVEVCIVAADMPQLCDPHETRLCWQFTIPGAGPQITLLQPADGAFTHDRQQKIIAKIQSENGIPPENISITINGEAYRVDGTNITFENDTLTIIPQTDWEDGSDVAFVISCQDNLALTGQLSGNFRCDFSPPECVNPRPFGVVENIPKEISVNILDDGTGVDPQSILFRVGDLFLPFDNYAVVYDGINATLNLDAAGLHIGALDTVEVSVIAADQRTGFGEPNIMNDCTFWFLPIKTGCAVGPTPFTPNGDGINDEVEFATYNEDKITITVFTMDGVLVRKLDGEMIVHWDGKDNNGRNVPPGPYIYTIEAAGKNVCKGIVVIAR